MALIILLAAHQTSGQLPFSHHYSENVRFCCSKRPDCPFRRENGGQLDSRLGAFDRAGAGRPSGPIFAFCLASAGVLDGRKWAGWCPGGGHFCGQPVCGNQVSDCLTFGPAKCWPAPKCLAHSPGSNDAVFCSVDEAVRRPFLGALRSAGASHFLSGRVLHFEAGAARILLALWLG